MSRTHLSASAEPITLRAVDQTGSVSFKPKGFWYQVDGDWLRWCQDEDFGLKRCQHVHAVDLGDANVLMLDTLAKLDDFHERFSLGFESSRDIDWRTVATQWDGLEISPYQWPRRYDYLWYYGWDCASGVIWRPKTAAVTYVEELVSVAADIPEET